MPIFTPGRRRLLVAFAAGAVLAPGWSGRLVPVDHDLLLDEAGRSHNQTGVTRPGAAPGEEWHLQYLDSWPARVLDEFGLRARSSWLVPPDFVAHIPAGSARADGYYRNVTSWHWPWWRPGGGVAWEVPTN
ncbi:MAG: hypothetical protein K8T90_20705 [Planctomycetes bacterium]|nr:hypothetical protein [Planctomycetota bacterium]